MARPAETICALATGAPPSALAIIRVSGPDVRALAARLLDKGLPGSRQVVLDTFRTTTGEVIDRGLVTFMPGPTSFTGEDTLELTLHGGRVIVDLALSTLYAAGARLAEPGEFTRRAFEAGKLDLTRAEAIADLIDAESEAQHKQALRQFDGALADLYASWRETLTQCLALLEASIDFPDEDDAPDRVETPVRLSLTGLTEALESALAAGNITERIRDGFRVAILGRPNAGKSTLLNRLAGREAAIVTDIPGTTRDVIEVRLVIGGMLVWIADTAGLRDSDDEVEQEGVRRARKAAEDADIRVWVHDAREPAAAPDSIGEGDIIVANKADLVTDGDVSRETFAISAQSGDGVDALLGALGKRLDALAGRVASPVLTRARHRQAIAEALGHLRQAEAMLDQGFGAELVAEEVRLAARVLGTLTGHVEVEQVLGAVFSSFCIGK